MDLTQLGLGGLFAIVVIREVLTFLAKRKDSREQTDFRSAIEQACEALLIPVLDRQTEILDRQSRTSERIVEMLIKGEVVLGTMAGRQESMNTNLHELRNRLHGRAT